MARNKKFGKVVNLLVVVWLLLMPFFWQFNLSVTSSGYYDSFLMATLAPVHIVIFFVLIFASIYLNGFSLWHLLLLGLYFTCVQLVNYPYLTIRDVFLGAGASERVVATGHLAVSKIPTAYQNAALSEPFLDAAWPGTYFVQGIFMEVTGLGVVASNYVLYLCIMIAVLLVIYSFSVLLSRNNYSLGWAGALLFLPLFFNYLFDNFHLYSRTAFAFTLYFLFIFVFLRFETRTGLLLSSILAAATIISHPFQSLALIVFVLAYALLIGKNRSKIISFTFLLVTMFLAWIIFQTLSQSGQPLLLTAIVSRFKTFLSAEFTTPLTQSLSVLQPVPWWGLMLRNYFKYVLGTLLGVAFLAGAFVFFKSKIMPRIYAGLIAILLSAVVMLVGLLLLPDWGVARFTAFAAFPAAFSSLVLVAVLRRNRTIKRFFDFFGKRVIVALLLIFILSFSVASLVLRFEANYYYGELYHPSEMASLSFFFSNTNSSTENSNLTIVSWITYIYSIYFNYNYSYNVSMVWVTDLVSFAGNSTALLNEYRQDINDSQFALRGMRDTYTITSPPSYPSQMVLQNIDQVMLVPQFDQIYSNGNYQLFARKGT